jgi:hypothetical protein
MTRGSTDEGGDTLDRARPARCAWDGSLGESGGLHFSERKVQPIQGIPECQTEMPVLRGNYTLKGTKPTARKAAMVGVCGAEAQERLKYWTARSCCCAACRVWKVPRLRRLPVFAFFLLEYKRYSPVFNFRITVTPGAPRNQPLVRRWVFLVRLAFTAAL